MRIIIEEHFYANSIHDQAVFHKPESKKVQRPLLVNQ